jgi:hypothetical protein
MLYRPLSSSSLPINSISSVDFARSTLLMSYRFFGCFVVIVCVVSHFNLLRTSSVLVVSPTPFLPDRFLWWGSTELVGLDAAEPVAHQIFRGVRLGICRSLSTFL